MTLRREVLIVILIVSIAAFFRLYKLDTYPPGLYPDEAMNGNNALHAIETGDYKIFYPENNGREGLFMNLQSLSIRAFGNTPFALRFVSAIFGTLTVLGLYLLARRLFNWEIAAMASFLMAVSFWHVVFSRIGFRAIMAPMFIVWGLYFLWKGLATTRKHHFVLSAISWGLGFYSYISFRVMPSVILVALLAYWHSIKRDFSHERYLATRNHIIQGLALFMLVVIAIVLPLGWHFYTHPEAFMGRLNDVSVFSSENPVLTILKNTGKTLGMFNFIGDHNWRHNLAGQPILFFPIGIFFVLGFFKSIWKLEQTRKRHGHFSPPHAMLLTWFFVGLLPVILSTEGIPHSLRAIVVIPVVYIFVAEGLWWLIEYVRDPHHHKVHVSHSSLAAFSFVIFLLAIGGYEFKRYFYDWGPHEAVRAEFNQNYVDVAYEALAQPRNRVTYILVNRDTGVAVNGIPVTAQTVMYITDTWTPEKQRAKNIFYLTQEQYDRRQYLAGAKIIPLEKK